MSQNNIIITGVNGFIGSHLSQECIKRGITVIGIGRDYVSLVRNVVYYQMDLDTDSIDALLKKYKPYAVIHCAGMADVNYSIIHPDTDFATNVMVSRKILYTIKDYMPETKFIFLSSAAVYGNPRRLPIVETSVLEPISPYALHKLMVENFCHYFVKQFDLDIRVLRIFSTYGSGLKKQIFWDMGQKLSSKGNLEMFGTGNETRDFIHISDLLNAIFLILDAPKNPEIVYNVANGEETSIREVAETFAIMCGKEKEDVMFNNVIREGNPLNWRADISKLSGLGYKPGTSIYEGIREYVDWLRSLSII